ncbi:MAG: glutamate mutase L [Anaerolineales bacterium]|nr:glutamate mutase L [Anaerolineales bacterium]
MTENGQPTANTYQSFLLADCGHTTTTVILFDVVDGTFRFVAKGSATTTIAPPQADLSRGIRHAIEYIEEATHRTLLSKSGQLISPTNEDGQGVDFFGLTVSATEPLKGIVIGLANDLSVTNASQVLHSVYASHRETFSVSDQRSAQRQIDAIRFHRPDVIIIAGGTDGGAEEQVLQLVEIASIGVQQLPPGERAQIIYAGNSALREAVKDSFANSTIVHMANNINPRPQTVQTSDAKRVMQDIFQTIRVNRLPGMSALGTWLTKTPQATMSAVATVCQYLATVTQGRVLTVDVGSNTVSLIEATAEEVETAIFADLGVGVPINNLLRYTSAEHILRWVPDPNPDKPIKEENLVIELHNMSLFPKTIPATPKRLRLLQGILRELIHYVVNETGRLHGWPIGRVPQTDLLILRGNSLIGMPRPAQAILTVLDATQPTGTFAVAMDEHNVLPAVGYLAQEQPVAAVQILENGVLTDLGWVVVLNGQGSIGDDALKITIEIEGADKLEQEVLWGSLTVIPLAAGVQAQVTLKPERLFDVGNGAGKKKTLTVHGGEVGLVIDARGRPLPIYTETDSEQQHTAVLQWIWDMGG